MITMSASHLVCASCNVVSVGPSCAECDGELSVPTAVDCAKFGLLPELLELVEQVNDKSSTPSAGF